MSLRKFPVYSDAGNEYAVTLREPEYFDGMSAIVYVKDVRWFGLRKWRRVAGGSLFNPISFSTENWGYDYKAMAKHAVNKYESDCAAEIQRMTDEQIGRKEFEKWDGR